LLTLGHAKDADQSPCLKSCDDAGYRSIHVKLFLRGTRSTDDGLHFVDCEVARWRGEAGLVSDGSLTDCVFEIGRSVDVEARKLVRKAIAFIGVRGDVVIRNSS